MAPRAIPPESPPPRWSGGPQAAGRRGGLVWTWLAGMVSLLLLGGCADRAHQLIVSIPEQRMVLLKNGVPLGVYPVSTSRFGLGDEPGSRATPLGNLEIARKIGDGLPAGAVLKSRVPNGEVLTVDAPGRDPVVTRILWLRGLDAGNSQAYDRYIYIHGTPEERNIGKPASFGCVRMRSADIIALYEEVGTGARVTIADQPLAADRPIREGLEHLDRDDIGRLDDVVGQDDGGERTAGRVDAADAGDQEVSLGEVEAWVEAKRHDGGCGARGSNAGDAG